MKKILTLCMLLIACTTKVFVQAQGTLTVSLITPPCNNNGVLQATASGLTGTITYQFINYVTSFNVTNTTGTLTGYSGSQMWVYATGSNGTADGYYIGAPPFNYNVSTTAANCPALSSATATITGGTAPYTVEWSPLGSTTITATGATASLQNGDYSVKITDAAGCVFGTAAKGDSIYVRSNSGLTLNETATTASCTNGSASVSVAGGIAPYSYQWSNGANTSAITGLVMGSYYVDVTDAQGCTNRAGLYVSQTPYIAVNVTPTPATCQQINGSAMAFGSGGTPPYSYQWANTQTTQTATGLTGGNYYEVKVTDAAGCIGNGQAYINSSTPIFATYTSTASSCTAATGTATVVATGGATPYTILWNTFPAQTGATATALVPGTYSFTVTDANGCKRTGEVVVPPVSIIIAGMSSVNATCTQLNGSAAVAVSGGISPYTYLWSNGATSASITNLAAGSYNVKITDNTGCKITKSTYIQASSPINAGLNTTQSSCIYAADGAITVTATGGTAPYTYNWNNGGTSATVTGLITGHYDVTVHDAVGCVKSVSSFVPYNMAGTSCYCTITGTVYHDLNNNCTKDAGEPGIANVMIHATGLGYAYTDATGVYSFKALTGTYVLSEVVQATYPLAACQNNAQSVSVTAAAGCSTTVNFANIVNPIHDVSVHMVSFNSPVPGNDYYQKIVIANNGSVAESGVLAGYSPDAQLSSPVFVPGVFSANGTANYRSNSSFGTLVPGGIQDVTVSHSVPVNIPLGTTLQYRDTAAYTAPITNWLNDYTPWNNVNAYTATVVGSFDPNNKEVYPVGTGTQGYIKTTDSTLTYTIHFQNTGTYPAQKVVLVDTLSNNLQVSSVRVGASSHNYKASITEAGVMTFTFDNINLPDSGSNLLGSMGYVIYTVRQKTNLAAGTQIKNKAAIYFDYNKPVITNTTLNTIQTPSGIGHVNGHGTMDMSVYPNPAKDVVGISIESNGERGTAGIRFVNLVGQVVLQQDVAIHAGHNVFEAAVSNLIPGLYFVEVSDGQRSATTKLSIVR